MRRDLHPCEWQFLPGSNHGPITVHVWNGILGSEYLRISAVAAIGSGRGSRSRCSRAHHAAVAGLGWWGVRVEASLKGHHVC